MAQCEMLEDCPRPVTHIGEKGYIYCQLCAANRRGWERTRKLAKWELALIEQGKQILSYSPITLAEYRARTA